MKEIFKNYNNLIKKTVFKVKNKTNNKLSPFKVPYKKNNKLLISNFNNLIQKIIFKVENKQMISYYSSKLIIKQKISY